MAQHDLKRLLAYHSVENIGIIALGVGLGMLGQALGHPAVGWLGFSGALLHVLNHGIFKGLLFLGAGSVFHATGTRDIDSLGGLSRRMPWTSLAFVVGAVAICGLPPLNGFVSEWLIFLGALSGGGALPLRWAAASLAVVPVLALIGGMAAACFVKVFGVVFLGEARTDAVNRAHEAPGLMRLSMAGGGLLCLAIGLWPGVFLRLVAPAVQSVAADLPAPPLDSLAPLTMVSRSWASSLAA